VADQSDGSNSDRIGYTFSVYHSGIDHDKIPKLTFVIFFCSQDSEGLIKRKGSAYSITEHRVPELIPVRSSQPAGEVSHKPGGRLLLLSARPAVTPQPLR